MKKSMEKLQKLIVKEKGREQAGITLVALVVTIIIIVILATVTINMAFGDDGIIKRAELAKDMYTNDIAYTDQSMANATAYLDGILNKVEEGEGEPEKDTTGPTITNIETIATENTITVVITAEDESGLAEIETYTYYLNEKQQGEATVENTKIYTGLQPSTEYTIKVVVKDRHGNASEKTIQVSTTEPEVPDIGDAKPNPGEDGPVYKDTTTILDDLDNEVVIPGGFHLDADSGTKVEEGIVIEDDEGNQFVWIPTGTYNVTPEIEKITEPDAQDGKLTNELTRKSFSSTGATILSEDASIIGSYGALHYGEENSNSVAKNQIIVFKANASPKSETNPDGNGGFYIGRYEQGQGNVCKAGVAPYTNITRDTAKSQAEAMYSGKNNNVVSELISSYAWDTALNFMCQTNNIGYTLSITSDRNYGNLAPGSKQNTSQYLADNYSKIHDLIGNCYEWTTEYSNGGMGPCVTRGGSYITNGTHAAFRSSDNVSTAVDTIAFRVQLYLK